MSFGAILDGFHKKKRGTDIPLLRMEVVRITLISRNRNQSTLIYARTITLLLLIIEVSHVSIRKTSITLRVPLCWRHRFRLKNRRKDTKKSENKADLEKISYFCGINQTDKHNDHNNVKL